MIISHTKCVSELVSIQLVLKTHAALLTNDLMFSFPQLDKDEIVRHVEEHFSS